MTKYINIIEDEKEVTFLNEQGTFTVKHLGADLFTITVHYAHNRVVLINRKILTNYLREHKENLVKVIEVKE